MTCKAKYIFNVYIWGGGRSVISQDPNMAQCNLLLSSSTGGVPGILWGFVSSWSDWQMIVCASSRESSALTQHTSAVNTHKHNTHTYREQRDSFVCVTYIYYTPCHNCGHCSLNNQKMTFNSNNIYINILTLLFYIWITQQNSYLYIYT